jgi:uncharacterized protein YbaP (TraB family)
MAAENLRKLLSPEQLAQMDAVREQLRTNPAALDKAAPTQALTEKVQDNGR